jgi:hypothetical protein
MPKHPFSSSPSPATSSYQPKIVKIALPPGWHLHVSQGNEFKVELVEELRLGAGAPGDEPSPSPK